MAEVVEEVLATEDLVAEREKIIKELEKKIKDLEAKIEEYEKDRDIQISSNCIKFATSELRYGIPIDTTKRLTPSPANSLHSLSTTTAATPTATTTNSTSPFGQLPILSSSKSNFPVSPVVPHHFVNIPSDAVILATPSTQLPHILPNFPFLEIIFDLLLQMRLVPRLPSENHTLTLSQLRPDTPSSLFSSSPISTPSLNRPTQPTQPLLFTPQPPTYMSQFLQSPQFQFASSIPPTPDHTSRQSWPSPMQPRTSHSPPRKPRKMDGTKTGENPNRNSDSLEKTSELSSQPIKSDKSPEPPRRSNPATKMESQTGKPTETNDKTHKEELEELLTRTSRTLSRKSTEMENIRKQLQATEQRLRMLQKDKAEIDAQRDSMRRVLEEKTK